MGRLQVQAYIGLHAVQIVYVDNKLIKIKAWVKNTGNSPATLTFMFCGVTVANDDEFIFAKIPNSAIERSAMEIGAGEVRFIAS